ncbi:MAG: succinate dehydrogenase assembly factor 2 [Alphaproteobacteria bacterium]|nr:succinate dehydrogenase assembly factor 2 [Alphaproteobacteria bacterium]
MTETLENKRKRLIFRSWHRGTREMDLILGSFADRYLPEFAEAELDQYDAILNENDPNLYNWITGREPVPEGARSAMMERLLEHRYKV